jgi:hypothetical protein
VMHCPMSCEIGPSRSTPWRPRVNDVSRGSGPHGSAAGDPPNAVRRFPGNGLNTALRHAVRADIDLQSAQVRHPDPQDAVKGGAQRFVCLVGSPQHRVQLRSPVSHTGTQPRTTRSWRAVRRPPLRARRKSRANTEPTAVASPACRGPWSPVGPP